MILKKTFTEYDADHKAISTYKMDYEEFIYRVFKYNFEGYYSDDDYDMFGSNDYDYDDDELFDATADLLSNHPEKKRSHAEMDDTFKMDVIDLD